MWKWFYYGNATTCMDDYMFVFHMDLSLHYNNESTWGQHVFRKYTLTNFWLPQLPCHSQQCLNYKESGEKHDNFVITYISHIATIECILSLAIQNYVSRILRCLDTSKQKESCKERRFALVGFIGIEKKIHTK
jgi:hypothetical protein